MKLTTTCLLSLLVAAAAWSQNKMPSLLSPSSTLSNAKAVLVQDGQRRAWLVGAAATVLITALPQPSAAGLLEEFGTDPAKIVQPEKSTANTGSAVAPKGERAIDPTLRASYYYPTAKKRYLPRIQKVTQQITSVPDDILSGNWVAVESFSKTAENAILPLQLYQSSLDGQGLGMTNEYAKAMKQDAMQYEKSYKIFLKAISEKDAAKAIQAVTDMGVAVADYRQQGRLTDDDGNIPSIDDMRRMAMRKPTVKILSQQ